MTTLIVCSLVYALGAGVGLAWEKHHPSENGEGIFLSLVWPIMVFYAVLVGPFVFVGWLAFKGVAAALRRWA